MTIFHRIREMLTDNALVMLSGLEEVNETQVGGSKKKLNKIRNEVRIKGEPVQVSVIKLLLQDYEVKMGK